MLIVSHNLQKLYSYCFQPCPIAPLVTFRVLFGLALVISTLRFIWLGWIDYHFISTKFTFKYYGFEWITPLPYPLMYALHGLLLLAAVGICLGAWYRLCIIFFFLGFTYCELIDLTYYLNHYYFVSLVCLLLCLVPAHTAYSIDVIRHPEIRKTTVPFWAVGIFRLQLGIVYVYAGLAKINTTWLLEALPLRIWLPTADKMPILGWFFKQEITAYLFAWAGMFYDTFIVFFLAYHKTRWFAYVCVIFFHVIVGLLFQIGVFPIVMILATPVFFNAYWHEKVWDRLTNTPCKVLKTLQGVPTTNKPCKVSKILQSFTLCFWGLFFTFQLLFPWRYLLYDGNLFWTEEGYRFSWRVMLMEKAGTATFYVKDSKTQSEGVVVNSEFLNSHQEKQMAMQPDMLLQFAHFLQQYYTKQGISNPQVRAEVYVTLNGQPSQLLFSPWLDLTKIKDSWAKKDWIFPYKK